MRKPAHSGWHHSPGWDSGLWNKENWAAAWIHDFLALILGIMWPAAPHSCLLYFPALGWTIEQWPQLKPPPIIAFIKAAGRGRKTIVWGVGQQCAHTGWFILLVCHFNSQPPCLWESLWTLPISKKGGGILLECLAMCLVKNTGSVEWGPQAFTPDWGCIVVASGEGRMSFLAGCGSWWVSCTSGGWLHIQGYSTNYKEDTEVGVGMGKGIWEELKEKLGQI